MFRTLFFAFIFGCTFYACSNDNTGDGQEEQTGIPEAEAPTAAGQPMSDIEVELKEVQTKLNSRLESLRGALDTTVVQERPELEGKIRKLEAREKQLTQHLKKFEQELSDGEEKLEKRFKDLITDIKADLKAVE